VGRRMRWARSPGVGAMAPSRRLALRVTTKSAVPSSRPKDQELFAFLAGGERLVAARQRCDRRHRAAALAATAGRRGDPAHQTRTRGVRPAGGPVPCTGVRQNRALAEHLIRTAHAACREPEAPQRPVASWYLKARDLVWSRQRHGKWQSGRAFAMPWCGRFPLQNCPDSRRACRRWDSRRSSRSAHVRGANVSCWR
jgi:hypothetical protein